MIRHLGTKKLQTKRLILRRIQETDAEELCEGFVNQEEFLYYANKEKRTLAQERQSLLGIEERYQSSDYYNWVIALKENDRIVGSINLRTDDYNDCVEFNYAIDNRYVNRGFMTEALHAVKKYCFEELNVNRFQGGCCVENGASKRVMEKCGMRLEGKLKDYIRLRDGYHDMLLFAITKNAGIEL